MDLASVMAELEALGTEQTRKTYQNHGAREPLFGVTLRDMKPLAKTIKKDHALAMELYATGNYDAQTLAGIVAEPDKMTASDFERWMETANCRATVDYVVAVTLAETGFAEELADRWIDSGDENDQSAGWNCYCRLLSSRPDEQFDRGKLNKMLQRVVRDIHGQSNWVKYAMITLSYRLALLSPATRRSDESRPENRRCLGGPWEYQLQNTAGGGLYPQS